MQYVYWYHLVEHSDPYTQGYVGVTSQPAIRERCHFGGRRGGSSILYKAVQKYGEDRVIKDILHTVEDAEAAYALEKSYRPTDRIGWNIASGGGLPPDCTGRKDSKETREKRTASIKAFWQANTRVSPYKGVVGRFTQEQRIAIGKAQKGKEISEQHRKAITDKNSGNLNVNAKQIRLTHKDMPEVVYTYPCIKDAADALNIPYNTLRSQAQRSIKNQQSSEPSRTGWICLCADDVVNSVEVVKRIVSTRNARFAQMASDRELNRKTKGTDVAISINR